MWVSCGIRRVWCRPQPEGQGTTNFRWMYACSLPAAHNTSALHPPQPTHPHLHTSTISLFSGRKVYTGGHPWGSSEGWCQAPLRVGGLSCRGRCLHLPNRCSPQHLPHAPCLRPVNRRPCLQTHVHTPHPLEPVLPAGDPASTLLCAWLDPRSIKPLWVFSRSHIHVQERASGRAARGPETNKCVLRQAKTDRHTPPGTQVAAFLSRARAPAILRNGLVPMFTQDAGPPAPPAGALAACPGAATQEPLWGNVECASTDNADNGQPWGRVLKPLHAVRRAPCHGPTGATLRGEGDVVQASAKEAFHWITASRRHPTGCSPQHTHPAPPHCTQPTFPETPHVVSQSPPWPLTTWPLGPPAQA